MSSIEQHLKSWFDNADEQPLRQVFVKLFTPRGTAPQPPVGSVCK